MSMFCYQCQEAIKNTGCTKRGACGKTEQVSNLQDLLIHTMKGISFYGTKARELDVSDPDVDRFVMEGLFTTITNVSFDADRVLEQIQEGLRLREIIKGKFMAAYSEKNGSAFAGELPDAAVWTVNGGINEFLVKAATVGVLATENEDVRSLRELLILGLKGIAAYAEHADALGKSDDTIFAFLQTGLAATIDDTLSGEDLTGLVLKAGEIAVTTMALLDGANTSTYGNPEITMVSTGSRKGHAILISGHDLKDMEELLEQTKGKGINIYTHGEMLPANAYPAFKKYDHLIGNFGSSWWHQKEDFENFNGAVLMTTNCLVPPKESYSANVFTTGVVAYPGMTHIADRKEGGVKDFSPVIAKAMELDGPADMQGKEIPIGFHHTTILSLADKVVGAVKSGALKRFFVMGGCDGRQKSRNYFTELAEKLPKDTVILTAGCAKYRYNMLDMGDIGGIPRVIDAGQCNDSYSLAVVALKLAEVFGAESINDLPVSFNIGWYEQKAVAVLLALLHLGVKGIRLGPTVPAFLSPNVVNVLVENFGIKPIGTVDEDLAAMMEGN